MKREEKEDATSVDSMLLDDDEPLAPKPKDRAKAAPPIATKRKAPTRATPVPSTTVATKGKPAAKSKTAATGRGKGKRTFVASDDDEIEGFEDVIMGIDDSEEESEEKLPPKRGRSRAAPAKR